MRKFQSYVIKPMPECKVYDLQFIRSDMPPS